MTTAIISTNFWKEEKIFELTPDVRTFYLCLLTNPERNTTPAFKCSDRLMSAYTGYNIDVISLCKTQLIEKGFIQYVEGYYILISQEYVKPFKGKLSQKLYDSNFELLPLNIRELLMSGSRTAHDYNNNNNNNNKNKNKNKDKDNSKTKEKEIINILEKIDLEKLKVSIQGTCNKLNKEEFSDAEIEVELQKINDWFLNSKKRYDDYQAFTRNWFVSKMDKRKSPPIVIQGYTPEDYQEQPEEVEEPERELTEYEKFQLDPDYNFDKTKRTHADRPQSIGDLMGYYTK